MDLGQGVIIGDAAAPKKGMFVTLADLIIPRGFIVATCRRKDGSIRWQTALTENLITNEGKKYLLEVALKGSGVQAQISAWFMGLIDNTGASPVAGDTSATNGTTEIVTYNSANRPSWTHGAVTGTPPEIDNSAQASPHYDFAGSGADVIVKGCYITSKQTQGDGNTGQVLFASGLFDGSVTKTVSQDETLDVTYKFTT